MNKRNISIVLVVTGAILFNLVFWHERMDLNTVLYDVFMLTSVLYLYAEARQSASVRWLLLGHLTCLAMVLLHHTDVSKIGCMITLLLITGFASYSWLSWNYADDYVRRYFQPRLPDPGPSN